MKPSLESKLTLILEEQCKTNHLLALLIDALAEDEDGDDDQREPATYLDGTPREQL